jgi:hypothetical protein
MVIASPGERHAVSRGKAAVTRTGGAYEGVREYGQEAGTPLAAFFNTPII